MKHITLFFNFLLLSCFAMAQAPNSFNYQAAVRDADGDVLANKAVAFRISILETSSSGTAVYVETHNATTNDYGLVNLSIGNGTTVSGDLATINWGSASHFIKTEMDATGGTNYTEMSTQQLLSVPYALSVANDKVDDADNDPTNEIETWSTLAGIPSGIADGDDVDDADSDATNELQTISKSGSTVTLSNSGGSFTDAINDADANPSNELQTISKSGSTVTLSNGGGNFTDEVDDNDADATNEYNTGVSLSGTTLSVTDGGGSETVDLASLSNWTASSGNIHTNTNTTDVGIGITNPLHSLAVMRPEGSSIGIGSNNFNADSSGSLIFSEDLDIATGDCGFKFEHNGSTNELSLMTGCYIPTSGDTILRFSRNQGTTMTRVKLGNTDAYSFGNPLSVEGNSDFTGTVTITGNLNVSGSISKGSGTFKIDHPQDPANKYLVHSFVESPEMINVYSGNIVTDAEGYATVQLPTYFEAANKDFRYQLTVIGTFAQAIVLEKIADNSFKIQTNAPNVEVSWSVTGVHSDKFANANRVVPELEKEIKGSYLHPKLYGASPQDAENVRKEAIQRALFEQNRVIGADGQ